MTEPQDKLSGARFYVPFDEWLYRNIIDLCLDFCYNYQELNTDNHDASVARCENIFESLMDFASDCEDLPVTLRDPPIEEWSIDDRMPGGVIHQRRALSYVMLLMNELKRQQGKTGRDPNFLVNKYGLGKKHKKTEEDRKTYEALFKN